MLGVSHAVFAILNEVHTIDEKDYNNGAMKQNKNAKEIKTIKGAVIEIIVSIVALIVVGAVLLFDFSEHHEGGDARFSSRLPSYALFLGIAFIALLHGIVMVPVIIKKRKAAKAKEMVAIDESPIKETVAEPTSGEGDASK